MNLWHDVSVGENAPETFNTVIEIPRGSLNKYEIDKETGLLMLDRVAHTAQAYPFDYGFAPQTLWDDGDALDVMVFTTEPLYPGIFLSVRPVGVMRMIDDGESDDKIIAVPEKDKRWDDIQDISDLNKHSLKTIQHYFETYKDLQDKKVTINGFEDKRAAQEAVTRSIKMYQER